MKDCKQIIKHIPDFLAGNLNQLKSGQINQHLKSCLTCQVEIESLSSIWQKLSALPEDKPDESLKIRFNNMLDVYKLGMKQKTEPIVLRTIFKKLFVSWQIKQPFLQFASVILLVLIGLVSGYSLHPLI